MKKAILILLAIGGGAAAQAQQQAPNPGSILIYGNLGISTATDAASRNFLDWNVSPGVGYQFNDHMTVGLNISWAQSANDTLPGNITQTVNRYDAGAFFRYTHPLSNIFFAYAQFNGGYRGTYTTSGSVPAYGQATGYYANIVPALGVHVGKAFALNFSVGYIGYASEKFKLATNSSSRFDFTLGRQFNIGISKNIGGRSVKSEHQPMDDTRNLIIDED